MKSYSRNDPKVRICRIISWVLTLVLALAGLQVPAFAGGSLSISYGTPSAGSSLKVSWNKMDDADHYEVSVRNLTTGSLIYDHEHTTSRSFKISGSYLLENNSYRVWVGAYRAEDTEGFPPASYCAQSDFTVPSDTCYHTNGTRNETLKKVYRSISDTEHQSTETLNRRCVDCDEIIEKNVVVEEVNPHFLDENGDCKLCNYTASCTHKNVEPQIEKTSYSQKNENVHLYVEMGHYVCQNASCGKTIKPYYNETEEKHTFKSNQCKYCGYTRAEALSVTVARSQKNAQTGESISATATAEGGSGSYSYAWEVICDGSVIKSTDYSMPSSYNYVADKAGRWKFKVYVKDKGTQEVVTATTGTITVTEAACSHSSTRKETTDTKYIKTSDTKHEIRTYYRVLCASCGETISAENYSSEVVSHTLDASGRCVCGYVAPTSVCSHSSKTTELIGKPRVEQYSAQWHKVISTYKDLCASCGAVLTASREESQLVVHSFDANGKCACGYCQPTQQCDHATTKTALNPRYIAVDAKQHHYTVTYHYECECGKVNYNESAQSFAPHVFNGNTCRLCGYTKTQTETCDHTTTRTELSSKVVDDLNSDTTHFVVTSYREQCACGKINRVVEEKQSVACSFVKNAGVQALHEAQGHQYFDRCECGNAVTNGSYTEYLSTCAICRNAGLSRGMSGDRVAELQRMLGFAEGDIDGIFGGQTEAAVKDFQGKHNLSVTGIVDEATWNAIVASRQQPEEADSPDSTEEGGNITISMPKQAADEAFAADAEVKERINSLIKAGDDSLTGGTIGDITAQGEDFNLGKAISQVLSEPTDMLFRQDLRDDAKDYLKARIKESLVGQAEQMSLEDSALGNGVDFLKNVSEILEEIGDGELTSTKIEKSWKLDSKIVDADKEIDILGTAILFLKAVDIQAANEEDKRQILALVNAYAANVEALNNMLSSTQDPLVKEACQELLSEIEQAKEGLLSESKKRGMMSVAELTASEAFGVLADAIPAFSTISWMVNKATAAENATFENQDDMIVISYVRSLMKADLKQSMAMNAAGTYDLFELYATIEQNAYETTQDFYENYGNTIKGKLAGIFGEYDPKAVAEILRKEENSFLIERGYIRGMWNRHYLEAMDD